LVQKGSNYQGSKMSENEKNDQEKKSFCGFDSIEDFTKVKKINHAFLFTISIFNIFRME
jgi:hypothetical protein